MCALGPISPYQETAQSSKFSAHHPPRILNENTWGPSSGLCVLINAWSKLPHIALVSSPGLDTHPSLFSQVQHLRKRPTFLFSFRALHCLGSGLRGTPAFICLLCKLFILITSSDLKGSSKLIKISEKQCNSSAVPLCIEEFPLFPAEPCESSCRHAQSACHSRTGL